MKFGIIGAGMIGQFHGKAIEAMTGGELHSVFDLRAEAAQQLAEQFDAKPFSDLEKFLADDELQLVTVGTPSGAHLEPSIAALNAGKHVICEKPLEITPERIDLMMRAAEENEVSLAAVLNRRFHPAMDAFKAAADAGRFGTLTSASAYVKWYRDQAYYDSAAWRGTWALDGGGALMNQSIHTIDALLYLAGPVVSVQANTACLTHCDIEVEDTAVALLEFANGARGIIEGATSNWSRDGHPARVQLSGDRGSAFLADEAFEIWDFMDETPEDTQVHQTMMKGSEAGLGANDPKAINFEGHQKNFEEVVSAIAEEREASVNAAEARKAVALICAIYESARNDGRKIELS
ncbi:MAG TPA: oxidoreductase [Verrucomicrobiales bacterium]|nr:oxidoreductase [Verrucomicrobiales bacterium]|tara:strand:+ start:4220 stop:5266 length:1047 start_codon:yes stop_codon:yes gene_type:complete